MTWQAASGVALILIGIFGVAWISSSAGTGQFRLAARLRGPGLVFALLTGVMIAGYSVLDKRGVQHVSPLLYVVLLTAGGGAGMFVAIRGRYERGQVLQEMKSHWRAIALAGVLQTAAYGLVLFALRVSPVSYVGPFREVGIVFGVIMGALVLKERVTWQRLAGATAIAVGAVVIALAP
jgi:drug/metabolite transporter (DMT)-like permease